MLNAHPRLASARLLVPPAAAGAASRRGRIRSRTPRTAAPPPRRALAAHNQVHKQDPCHVAIGRKPKGQIALGTQDASDFETGPGEYLLMLRLEHHKLKKGPSKHAYAHDG